MTRNAYDLTHLSHNAGHIGRLQTMTIIPVEAGASLELTMDGIARLAPTRKEIVSDCQVDICAFFVPHRILDPTGWISFLKGQDTGLYGSPIAVGADYRNADYLCLPTTASTVNASLVKGYNSIWYNYYSIKSYQYDNDQGGVAYSSNLSFFPTNEAGAKNCRRYGRLIARLPHVLNGGNQVDAVGPPPGWESQTLDPTDRDVDVNTTDGVFSITDLAQVQGRYRTKAENAWFTNNYQDLMQTKWGSHVTRDADPNRLLPELLSRQTFMLSGHDVDGTDAQTLGTFQGKTIGRIGFGFPRRHFAEHGNVWVMISLRYPLVHTQEVHPLLKQPRWLYDDVAGDTDRIGNTPPTAWTPGNWLANSNQVFSDNMQEPYGQHYRFQNNRVHSNFDIIPGYPFSSWAGLDPRDWYYYQDQEYEPTFNTPQIGQWQAQCLVKATKYSAIPIPQSSIFAGT